MKHRVPFLCTALLAAGCDQRSVPVDSQVQDRAGAAVDAACHTRKGSPSQLRQEGRYMVDEQNRVVLLHGVNAVWKLKPYYPPATPAGFTAADADWLRDHGFNSVRLGVLFTGVMPTEGIIDTAYLDNVDRVVQLLASRGIYVLFDFHQDIYNEKFGGEGFPDWSVYDDGAPATNVGFPQTYFTPTVSHVFDNLWLNKNAIWNRYAQAWTAVAARWKDLDHHGGFDMFNEPYPGSQFATCANPAGCPVFDTQYLQPMEQAALAGIRAGDPSNIAFFEPNFVFNGGAITGLGLLSAPDDANIGLSWHKYCLLGVVLHSSGFTNLPGCDKMHQLVSQNAETAIKNLHSTTLVTEFGASDDIDDLKQVMKYTELYNVGWQYWMYKEWGDPTTESQGSGGQGMFMHDADLASVKLPKLQVLERPYPQATAGRPVQGSLTFDADTKVFQYAYVPRCADAPTEIYVPALHYPHGYVVELTGARAISAPNASTLRLENLKDAAQVTVKITPPAA